RRKFGRRFVRRCEKRGLGAGGQNVFNGQWAKGRSTDAAELGKEFREAVSALRVPHEKRGGGAGGMAEQELCQLKAGVTGDTYDGDGFRRRHFSKASIFCWSAARVFLLAVMMRTVSSPAMVPAISGNLDASTAAARGCAPLGGVFRT